MLVRIDLCCDEMCNKFNFVTVWKKGVLLLFVFYSYFLICATVIKSVMCFHTFLTSILRQTNYTDCGQSKISGHTFLQGFIIRIQIIVKFKGNRFNRIYVITQSNTIF
jgi:hypothetical protein